MWNFLTISIISAFLTGFSESTRDCSVNPQSVCITGDEPNDFPGSAEELDLFCEQAMPYFECYIEHAEECALEEVTYDRKSDAVMKKICNKDTRLHENVVEILPCIKLKQSSFHRCYSHFRDNDYTREDYIKDLSEQGIHNVADQENQERCLNNLFIASCLVVTAGKVCGDTAKSAAMEILQSAELPFRQCNQDTVENFPDIVKVLELHETEEK